MGGTYRGLAEDELRQMEFRGLQLAKIQPRGAALEGHVAIVTGAAGAIGAGICERLLEEGCQVAATDISEDRLETLVNDLKGRFGDRVIGVPMDVTSPESVSRAFGQTTAAWGGLDFVIPNAGMAMVSSLAEMDLERFRRLERVNTEGTLTVLSEAARFFPLQGIGGDIVLISTKNVFAPGARFGAYSATKAAAHQLARIASLELAAEGIRVNMVAPDAIFGEGQFKSGLWAEVGPDRMRARGLDENALQEYYRERNLLKIKVTARHVANAVFFFLMRETPTTGATIPIDGGLPDSTPR
jgi:NAD(P)-dependent dehydrogenase (short-subunit alcohol dehydrogenase family)